MVLSLPTTEVDSLADSLGRPSLYIYLFTYTKVAMILTISWDLHTTSYASVPRYNLMHSALELSGTLPPISFLDRWCGEPIRAAILPTDIFITNRSGK